MQLCFRTICVNEGTTGGIDIFATILLRLLWICFKVCIYPFFEISASDSLFVGRP